ncbi:ABC transporter permease [Parafrigoribacterium humi]|uniref:ABC transporter permease n=1 Tax=Parafrigoribacterium humi TaxID=3144664 RepID=UPI0032EEFE2C
MSESAEKVKKTQGPQESVRSALLGIGDDSEPARAARRVRRRIPFRAWVGGLLLAVMTLGCIVGPFLLAQGPFDQVLSDALNPPSAGHWLGTDDLGRDLLSRLLTGGRYTVGIAVAATTLGMVFGGILGVLAGYRRGVTEVIIMRAVDTMLVFPDVLIAFVVVAILGAGTSSVTYAMIVYSIPIFARFAFGSTIAVMSREYIEATKSRGASDMRLIFRHVIPNILPEMVIIWTLRLGIVAFLVSGLSFLGLGVQPPIPEWGAMLSQGQVFMQTNPALVLIPGAAITLFILAINLLGDGLRDVLDPRDS